MAIQGYGRNGVDGNLQLFAFGTTSTYLTLHTLLSREAQPKGTQAAIQSLAAVFAV